MAEKKSYSDYTEDEFLSFVSDIWYDRFSTEQKLNKAVHHFSKIIGHPSGSDLIFYRDEIDENIQHPESLMNYIITWRAQNGLPGFKSDSI